MELLTDDQITAELSDAPGWTLEGGQITRTVQRKDFKDAIIFVGGVAFLAERANHHPDILIQWNKVTLTLFDALGGRPHRGRLQPGPAHLRPRLVPAPASASSWRRPAAGIVRDRPRLDGSGNRGGPRADKLIIP